MTVPWMYQGKEFTEDMIGDNFGFIYIITNKLNNKKYIGKKFFSSAAYKTINKKRKKIRKPSDWIEYWGSSPNLKKDIEKLGEEHFTKEIIMLCKNKGQLTYHETKCIMETDAILSDEYYNDWISCKVSKAHYNSRSK